VQYKELANRIEGLLSGQTSMFRSTPDIEKLACEAVEKITEKQAAEQPAASHGSSDPDDFKLVNITSMDASRVRSLGPEYVCHCQWNELHFNEILMENGISRGMLPLLEALIIGRLVSPGSERHTRQWAQHYSAIFELTGNALRASHNSLYRAGDHLFRLKDILEEALSTREKHLFSLRETMCFFDLTNTYFEGQANANPKAKRGRSKEKRSDCKLLTLALVIDEQGFAKYSNL
jgi:hypothetical protein